MRPLDLAHAYMACCYGEKPLAQLETLLSGEFEFEGPFYRFRTAADYIQALRDKPMLNASYETLHEYENEDSACLVYLFRKPGVETLMAQTFEVTEDKISRIRLIFDTSRFV